MFRTLIFAGLLGLTACAGPFKLSVEPLKQSDRQVASVPHKHFMRNDPQSMGDLLDERLMALHSYYLIGHKNLALFDEELKIASLEKLYSSAAYLNLLAVQTQTDEIEEELRAFAQDPKQAALLKERIEKFIADAPLKALSLEKLPGVTPQVKQKVTESEFKKEWEEQERVKDFLIYERNIEHLSHMLDAPQRGEALKFTSSLEDAGNVSGSEFPAKVWSISFNSAVDETILQQLAQNDLQADFFFLGSEVQDKNSYLKVLQSQGHGIGASSWTRRELTKIGRLTLDREIDSAIKGLAKAKSQIKFFRLPYGAGLGTSHIRAKLVEHNLIHASWTVDALDWMPQTASQITKRTLALMAKDKKDSGMVMFHAVHPRTSDAVAQIFNYLKKDGRRVCTLDEIVAQMNEGVETVCPLN